MEKQIIYNVLDGEITFDPQIVEYGRLREEFNDYDDELAQSISKFYEENKSSIMDMYLGENKYYDFMFRLYAEITENIKEHMKKYINIMIDHGVYDVEEDYFTSTANDSLVRLLEIAGKEHEIKCILWEHHTDMFNSGLDEARVVSFRRIEDKNYQKLIKCLSRLSRLEEKDNKEWLLKEYKEIVGAELKNLGSKVYDDKTSESIFVYLLSKHKDMKKALEEYFTQLFIYWGVDSIEQVFSEEEQKDFFEKYIKLPSDANGAKKYFYDSFEESVEQKYENWIKEKNKLKDMDARRIQIGTEIAANTKIAYENRNKIFGEGARRKKDAKNKITQLTEERNELERDLETRNKQLSKETEIIPFVDIEIRPSDNDYISKTLYQSERKCRAGFISKEECSKMQQDAITRSFNDITAQYESVMKQL